MRPTRVGVKHSLETRTMMIRTTALAFALLVGTALPALSLRGDDKATPAQAVPAEGKPADAAPEPAKASVEYVTLETSAGKIVLELDAEKSPVTVQNFLKYVDNGHYNGTIFHRVIKGFMIQGGGHAQDWSEKPTAFPPIKNEWQNGLKNMTGTIAMARKGDFKPNPDTVNSATSQFFINVANNDRLDQPQADGGAYTAFGKVVAGMDVVRVIENGKVEYGSESRPSKPVKPFVLTKASRTSAEEAKAAVDAQAAKQAQPADEKK
jgi:cyclophilin family peptidyl-prolyl cis-trans isomerase